ncbi:MAG TPA: alpha/beta hydrolase [Pseudonocardiaceae bacterium]|jgi:pimeloyl-ACP methyl ester carboxylesterase|nr:alpha/beta hydrolase [Pseudonocardiaceae bacterium]
MTEFVETAGGRIAYDVTGNGPTVVLAPGMGTTRDAYRFLAPKIVAAGYRVVNVDLRGHGESSMGWPSYTRTDTANDLLAVIRQVGGPVVMVGNSFSGGSATIMAATAPELVTAIVEMCPFTRVPKAKIGALLRNRRHRKGVLLLLRTAMTGSVGTWIRYLDHAYPGPKPADYAANLAELVVNLRAGAMTAARKMGMSRPTDAEAQLPNVHCPALIMMGTLDPDWDDNRAEAEAIVAAMPEGAGRYVLIEGAGHYPHAQYPDQVAAELLPFLAEHVRA